MLWSTPWGVEKKLLILEPLFVMNQRTPTYLENLCLTMLTSCPLSPMTPGWEILGPYQHLAAGRLRAIEHRVSIARAAQTGISAMILPSGRIAASIPLGEKGEIVYDAPIGLDRTFYSRHGNVFALTVLLLSAFGLLFVMFSRRVKV